jgi:hypothetical protein
MLGAGEVGMLLLLLLLLLSLFSLSAASDSWVLIGPGSHGALQCAFAG